MAVQPPATGNLSLFKPSHVSHLNRAYRCHGRWAGLLFGRNVSSEAEIDGAVAAATALRTFAKGSWLLPLAVAADAPTAIKLAKRGVALAMPSVPPLPSQGADALSGHAAGSSVGGGPSTAVRWAQMVVEGYEPMRQMLASSYYRPAASRSWCRLSCASYQHRTSDTRSADCPSPLLSGLIVVRALLSPTMTGTRMRQCRLSPLSMHAPATPTPCCAGRLSRRWPMAHAACTGRARGSAHPSVRPSSACWPRLTRCLIPGNPTVHRAALSIPVYHPRVSYHVLCAVPFVDLLSCALVCLHQTAHRRMGKYFRRRCNAD